MTFPTPKLSVQFGIVDDWKFDKPLSTGRVSARFVTSNKKQVLLASSLRFEALEDLFYFLKGVHLSVFDYIFVLLRRWF